MAGHSKWANIQHRKKAQDAKRGKIFTKLIREITVASRMGGSDLDSNPRLRLAVDKGLGANMNKDTIAVPLSVVLVSLRAWSMKRFVTKVMPLVALRY